ncbi:MAG TPA: hypothetical protein VGF69_13830 [Thermoanaerobaculia bacterium]|jgi:hypothetical protein
MGLLFRRFLCALALCAALSARADVRAVLRAPADGAVLRGGSRATVAWSAPELPAFVEEWEAFLSVDGGEYYGYRITPHLDVERREFTFEVPNVESGRARILIRAGNEHRETELETSQTFVIEQDPALALAAPPVEIVEDERGEAAREGDPGVVEWIDGDREGRELVERNAFAHQWLLAATTITGPESRCDEEEAAGSLPAPRNIAARFLRASPHATPHVTPRHRSGRDVLLSYRRLNI